MYNKEYFIITSLIRPMEFKDIAKGLTGMQSRRIKIKGCPDSSVRVRTLDYIHLIRGVDFIEAKCKGIQLFFKHIIENDKPLEKKYIQIFQHLLQQICSDLPMKFQPIIFIHWGGGTSELYRTFSRRLQKSLQEYTDFHCPVIIPYSSVDTIYKFLTSEYLTKNELIRELDRLDGTSIMFTFFSRLMTAISMQPSDGKISSRKYPDLFQKWQSIQDTLENYHPLTYRIIRTYIQYREENDYFIVNHPLKLREYLNTDVFNNSFYKIE